MGDLSPHFNRAEFACGDGCGVNVVSPRLIERLERLRLFLMRSVTVRSGARCPAHNAKEGGKADSAHLATPDGQESCEAADIAAETSRDRWEIVQGAIVSGFTRIGIGSNFVHLDVDVQKPQEVIWLY